MSQASTLWIILLELLQQFAYMMRLVQLLLQLPAPALRYWSRLHQLLLLASAMALRALPALNQAIWFSLKVWLTWKEYVLPSGDLPSSVKGLPGVKLVRPLMLILSKGPICSSTLFSLFELLHHMCSVSRLQKGRQPRDAP